MPVPEFGNVVQIDLREIWQNEATDFTPWLAQNIKQLGEVLGMDLELQTREAPVGTLSLDLLARDLGRNKVVIVENQLEPTNHDHLGSCSPMRRVMTLVQLYGLQKKYETSIAKQSIGSISTPRAASSSMRLLLKCLE